MDGNIIRKSNALCNSIGIGLSAVHACTLLLFPPDGPLLLFFGHAYPSLLGTLQNPPPQQPPQYGCYCARLSA